jgi:BCD family chlorophyll transporter-like MFS transporter
MACYGALAGLPAFALIILAAPLGAPLLFVMGVLGVGFGGGLFGHGTLTAAMNLAPQGQRGLALGAWGAVQATAAGAGVASGGLLRDLAAAILPQSGISGPYMAVYATEMVLLIVTIVVSMQLIRRPRLLASGRAG